MVLHFQRAQSPILQTIYNRHNLGAMDKIRVLGGHPMASHVYEVRGAAKWVGNRFFSVLVHSMETILKGTQEACVGRGTSHYLVGYLLDSQGSFLICSKRVSLHGPKARTAAACHLLTFGSECKHLSRSAGFKLGFPYKRRPTSKGSWGMVSVTFLELSPGSVSPSMCPESGQRHQTGVHPSPASCSLTLGSLGGPRLGLRGQT